MQNFCIWGARGKAPTHHREGERAATQDVINLEVGEGHVRDAEGFGGWAAFGVVDGRRAGLPDS
jgi:hypothetical protein